MFGNFKTIRIALALMLAMIGNHPKSAVLLGIKKSREVIREIFYNSLEASV